ncbi:hypothetical protein ACDY96_26135, partial [Rhizobium mongolense]
RWQATPSHHSEPGSSPLHNIEDPNQGFGVNVTFDANAPAAAKLDRHDARLLARPRRRGRFHRIRRWQARDNFDRDKP